MKLTDFKIEKREWFVPTREMLSTTSILAPSIDRERCMTVTDSTYVLKLERALEVLLGAVDFYTTPVPYQTAFFMTREEWARTALAEAQRILKEEK